MRRSLTVGALALAILTAGAGPALAKHDGDHRPRPVPPIEPRGLYQSGQLESNCTVTYPDGPTGAPLYVCMEPTDNRPEPAMTPQTGPINSFTGGNNPND